MEKVRPWCGQPPDRAWLKNRTEPAEMRSRVYVTVGRPSVRLSHRSTAATAAGGFSTERRRLQQISIDSCWGRAAGAGAQQQLRVALC